MNTIKYKVSLGRKQVGLVLENSQGFFYRNGNYFKKPYDESKDGQLFPSWRECLQSVGEDSPDISFEGRN